MSSETRTRCGFVEAGRARLYPEARGAAGAPVLLCLHGLGGGIHVFGALGVHLARQWDRLGLIVVGGLPEALPSARRRIRDRIAASGSPESAGRVGTCRAPSPT